MSNLPASSALPSFRVLVLPGDGIGREVVPAAVQALQATGLPFEFVFAQAGWGCFEQYGTSLPAETLAAARAADAILFGAVSSPSHPMPGYRSPIVALRRDLDLYANIRPVTNFRFGILDFGLDGSQIQNLKSQIPNPVDLVVVRENTEGLYAGQETSDGETAIAKRIITRRASERIARAAFELARSRRTMNDERPTMNTASPSSLIAHRSSFPKVTIVHKANVLRETCGLFRAAALRVAEEYPDVAADELLVDNAALQLVQRPERFDVIVTTNMFGDILSDVASYWGGGLGMASSANIGDRQALFEPVHGSAPDIAGRGIANPLAAIGCAALLLEYLGRPTTTDHRPPTADEQGGIARHNHCMIWAERIRAAIRATLASDIRTPDLSGKSTTEDVTNAVIAALAR